ncbi:MAG: hypothetical protein WBM31_24700 [Pseudolabrys sp.]|jgi:hypothetical protein
MRGFAVLLAYIVGLLTVVGGGTIGLMALNKLTPPVASVAAAPGLTVPMSLLGRADEVIE